MDNTEIEKKKVEGIKEANLVKKDIINILRAVVIGFLIMSIIQLIFTIF